MREAMAWWTWLPAASAASPPGGPGADATSSTAVPGAIAASTAAPVIRPRADARVGGAATSASTRATPANAADAAPGMAVQRPPDPGSPAIPNACDTAHPAKTRPAVAAMSRHTCREARAGAAASVQPSAMHSIIAISERTPDGRLSESSGARPSACTSATPVRHVTAAARNFASRRPSAASSSSIAVPLGDDFPAEHHAVVLVGQVVAVRDVRADEGPEAAGDHDLLARVQRHHVLLAAVVRMPGVGREHAVARDRPVLLHV